jgi:hypothetical protein
VLTDDEAIICDLLRMARRSPRGDAGRHEIATLLAANTCTGEPVSHLVPLIVGLIYSWTRPLYASR